ncbi:hypothetical protein DNTS_023798 [Danionella cerebrum]|uniref:Uncharacterized protein n=1 Tax=Danionella cerebrum TaxID=2873325 RepID=A0A553QQF8_9TELE|nr:hypothetical protein DNTS_023798 [Danionella translucida]
MGVSTTQSHAPRLVNNTNLSESVSLAFVSHAGRRYPRFHARRSLPVSGESVSEVRSWPGTGPSSARCNMSKL